MSFLGAIYSIRTGVPLEFSDQNGMVPSQHPAYVSQACDTFHPKLQFFSFIQGEGLATHIHQPSLNSAQRTSNGGFKGV